ncbi:MAG: hypothetical protein U1F36_12650 [Planctomycetota bacterium]
MSTTPLPLARAASSALPTSHWVALRDTLVHATQRVPLYGGLSAPEHDADLERSCRAALAQFPLLDKAALRRAFPHRLLPAGESLAALLRDGVIEFVGTSGTTSERVQVLWHQPWWNAQERAGFALHPLTDRCCSRDDYREAVLTTPVCSGNLCHVGALPMAERVVDDHILFLNQTPDPALWKDRDVLRMADELEAFRPHAIEADPAYLAHFVVRLRALGRAPHQPDFVDHSYSFPARAHLAAIRAAFACPVLDAYGSTECGFAFMQCEAGRYHHNAHWTHAELLPLDRHAGLEGRAALVLTTLRNPWLNLVRFDTGDIVRPSTSPCPCGRDDSLVLDALEGRRSDLVAAADGRLLTTHAVDRVIGAAEGLLHWRLRQTAPQSFELDLVPMPGAHPDVDAITAALAALLGAEPRTTLRTNLPVEGSGKFRLCAALHQDLAEVCRP